MLVKALWQILLPNVLLPKIAPEFLNNIMGLEDAAASPLLYCWTWMVHSFCVATLVPGTPLLVS